MKLITKNFICTILMSALGFSYSVNVSANEFISVPRATNSQQKQTLELIKTYYDALNKKDMNLFFSIMDKNVIHNSYSGDAQQGIANFKKFMEKANNSFDDKLSNIVIMMSADGKYAAAEWVDHGSYIKDYPGINVTAANQKYVLNGGHFFEIQKGKLSQVTTYYNGTTFMKQIKE